MKRGIVVALGGNALSPDGGNGSIAEQFEHTRKTMELIVGLARDDWQIALVHGNGPQVGNALIRNEMARDRVAPLPLGVLVAATEGWIGYMIQQSLQNALERAGIDRAVVTLVTQVLVDRDDPALLAPNKPIGRTMDEETARRLADELGWDIAPVKGGWRRVVGSPKPLEIIEREMIRTLIRYGRIVIAAGGGGTPVYRSEDGLEGVDAVIDKDRAAAILGREIGAEVLLMLTDIDAVYTGYGTPQQRPLRRLTVAEATELMRDGEFGAGSMGPKVESAIEFIRGGGRRAIIAALEQGKEAVAGAAGTEIVA